MAKRKDIKFRDRAGEIKEEDVLAEFEEEDAAREQAAIRDVTERAKKFHAVSQATGRPLTLDRASPHRMELYAAAAQIYHALQYIDRAGKQNLLKYSYSDFLDHLAAFKGLTREPEAAATTTLRFTLSAEREAATGIPVGTRAAVPDWSVYFATTQYMEIPAPSPWTYRRRVPWPERWATDWP